jgi:hypothetical protein
MGNTFAGPAPLPTDLGYATHVPGRMMTLLSQSCGAGETNVQSALCSAVASRCSNMTFNCENVAAISLACDINTTVQMAKVALAAEPETIRKQMAAQNINYVQDMETQVRQNCGSEQSSQETVKASVTCTDSSAAVLNVLNTLDATSACATAIVTKMVADARLGVAEGGAPAPPPISNQTAVIIAISMTLVLFIVILVAAGIVRQRKVAQNNTLP